MRKLTFARMLGLLFTFTVFLVAIHTGKQMYEESRITVSRAQCWFLEDRVREVLVTDLDQWIDHMTHNEGATLNDWHNLRTLELLTMYEDTGVLEVEVIECLLSLDLD